MDRFRGWARGKVLFARDGAPGAYLDQFARELQALRLELRMDTCDVRIGSRASGGPNKARNEDPTWKAAWESKGRDAVRPRTRRLPLRLFMMTTTVTSGYGGSSSSGSRSSLPLGLGRPRSARTSLLMLRPACATSTKFREKNREPLRGEPPSRGLERPSRGCRGGSRHSCGTGESANASFVRRTARGRVFAA